MTKKEIEKAIANDERVWFSDRYNEKVWEIDLNYKYEPEIYLDDVLYVYQNINDRFKQEFFIKYIFKTKAAAEHYLHHANITRTETLPFLTWEEFKEKRELKFNSVNGNYCELFILNDFIYLQVGVGIDMKQQNVGEATEFNFYRAYDECVRLFKEEI